METIGQQMGRALAFAAVAELRSFTRAADRLGCSKAFVSKQVARLERELGTQLLHRTTRRIELTDSGRTYLEHVRDFGERLADAQRAVSLHDGTVRGSLRLTAPLSLGEALVAEIAHGFRERYPDVRIDLDLSIVRRDLAAEGYDLAIRQAATLEDWLVARPLGVSREVLVAAPSLLARMVPPQCAEDLAGAPCIVNAHFGDAQHWLFDRADGVVSVPVDGPLRVNSFAAIRRLALLGAGVARLPLYVIDADLAAGSLRRVCAGESLVAAPLWLVWLQRRQLPLRVRVFADYVQRYFADPVRRAMFT